MFNLNLIDNLPKLEQVEINGVRHYTHNGKTYYPSVTTVLSADKSKQAGIQKWRDRVGEEEANRISHMATSRGTAVHYIMEDYILDQKPITKPMPIHVEMAQGLKDYANKYIDNIRMVEGQLWSDDLEVAGTVDLVADFEGEPAIIDWKTSNYRKKREYVESYFMQESAYAKMFEERTGIEVKKLVTLVAYPQGTQMFVEKTEDWIGKFIEVREMYDTQLQSMLPSEVDDNGTSDSRGVL